MNGELGSVGCLEVVDNDVGLWERVPNGVLALGDHSIFAAFAACNPTSLSSNTTQSAGLRPSLIWASW